MKKIFLLFISISLVPTAGAQISDRSETDCAGNTETVYGVLQTRILLVVSSGYDCSICQGEALEVQKFAAENRDLIRVWGALRYKYSAAKPTCKETNNWVNTYQWNDVFSFTDSQEYWSGSGFPYFQVIDVKDKTVQYAGYSFTDAKSKALSLAALGVKDIPQSSKELRVCAKDNEILLFSELDLSGADIRIFDMTGKETSIFITENKKVNGYYRIILQGQATKGIYSGSIGLKQGVLRVKFLLQ